ncbi:MAG: response regulator [Bacteroidia bacterium]|nr:response regulator [Bacteroidia bacterium]
MSQTCENAYIMVIEDSTSDIRLLNYCLQSQNFTGKVAVYNYGYKALEFLRQEQYDYPRLILMDIRLPDMDGLELLKNIKKHPTLGNIPVIVWTGQYSGNEAEKCQKLGAFEYFEKPIDINNLNDFVKRLSEYWDLS